ncbi:MATE family efflux transporter [Saccharicrinis fermentans]|uniref:Multidrug-efflux transporter n=1 Tax=Saccharicrinis fermentans DSM 9555 = JCM 21142 TaxID=869213 RepID=W7XXA8_9BACT|nr:MATE family efflux transporter [Saccharicrinis fermentans]GAF03060.1 multidrug export protein MepA [Saccharicrinis fermentans DSM 9555 = JCM 21142]
MKDLTVGNEAKLIYHFALPMVLGNLFQQLYSVVDRIIVGRYIDDTALAAIGASFPIFYALISFMIGIGSGATIVISQYFGAKETEKVKRAITTIFTFLFFASIVLMFIGIFFSEDIFRLLNVGEDVLPQSVEYFTVYMTGMIAFFGFNGTSSILRGLGDSKTPLRFLIFATILNIILDILFVAVFKWGIKAAAAATVISQFIAFAQAIIYLEKKQHIISFKLKQWVFDWELFKQSLRIGLPTGFQQTFIALSMMALIRIVNNFDSTVLAAYTVAGQIDSLAALPALNLASALSAFVGQNLGANKIDRIKKGLRATLFMSWSISFVVMLMTYLFSKPLMGLFSNNPEVVGYGSSYLLIVSSFYLIFSTMFVLHGVLRGAGATLIPMFITLMSLWIIRIPLAIFFSRAFGVEGIWWAIPAGWTFGMIGSLMYYLSGKWKRKGVIKHQTPKYEDI